jgi:hypothetical protein
MFKHNRPPRVCLQEELVSELAFVLLQKIMLWNGLQCAKARLRQ